MCSVRVQESTVWCNELCNEQVGDATLEWSVDADGDADADGESGGEFAEGSEDADASFSPSGSELDLMGHAIIEWFNTPIAASM